MDHKRGGRRPWPCKPHPASRLRRSLSRRGSLTGPHCVRVPDRRTTARIAAMPTTHTTRSTAMTTTVERPTLQHVALATYTTADSDEQRV